MKKFSFSLEVVLKQREIAVEDAMLKVAEETDKLKKICEEYDTLNAELKEVVDNQYNRLQNENINERSMEYVEYSKYLKLKMAQALENISVQEKVVIEARQELVKAEQEKKSIELLKEKEYKKFRKELNKHDYKVTDEINQVKYARKKN